MANKTIPKYHDFINTLLNKIKNELPEINNIELSHNDFSNDPEKTFLSLRRHHDPCIRKIVFQNRLSYLASLYSKEYAYRLAGLPSPKHKNIHDFKLNLPKTKLFLDHDHIIHEDGEIDYLIVGSGPAGAVIAHELARLKQGCRIVMIESGAFVKPQTIPTEFESKLMERNNQRTNTTGDIIIRNAETVGGGSTINLDLAFSPFLPSIHNRLNSWVKKGWIKFTQKELQEAYQWVVTTMGTRDIFPNEINRNNKLLMDASPDAQTYQLNARMPGKHFILKNSATEKLLLPALKGGKDFKGQLSLLSNVKVKRVIMENNKAVGLEIWPKKKLKDPYIEHNQLDLPQKPLTINAKNIILSAGALGSSEILLRSQIQNKNIGKGVVIHPSMGIIGRFPFEVNAMNGLSASVYVDGKNGYFFESMSAGPDFIAIIHPGSTQQIHETLKKYRFLGGFGIMLIDTVCNANQIGIDPKTDQVYIDYGIIDKDKKRLKEAAKKACNMLFDQGALEIIIPTSEPILSKDPIYISLTKKEDVTCAIENWKIIPYQNFISSAHMQSSNKIGRYPKHSVISTNFRVWHKNKEIPNLYVVDSSIFPTSVGANPMQTIYTFAKIFTMQHLSSYEKGKIQFKER